jgi:hypothetical protein
LSQGASASRRGTAHEDRLVGGPYLPPAYNRLRVQFPGNHGGVNWGGVSFNPQLGYLFINTNDLGQLSGLKDRPPNATGQAQGAGVGNRVDPNGPYEGVPGGGRFSIRDSGPQQLACQQPPWGQLTAVNVNTGEFVWRVPLGITESLPPEKQNTGRPGNGGTIATAGGLVFVAATDDARFRGFDAKTGKEREPREQRHIVVEPDDIGRAVVHHNVLAHPPGGGGAEGRAEGEHQQAAIDPRSLGDAVMRRRMTVVSEPQVTKGHHEERRGFRGGAVGDGERQRASYAQRKLEEQFSRVVADRLPVESERREFLVEDGEIVHGSLPA